ncbi:MAG: carbohydrate ABC transporter permease [Chloroflexi bacterium]|nr:carbohydrate ABC transporter permease [Chloroflexota bacterium]
MRYLAMILVLTVILAPIYWMIATSLKTSQGILKYPPQWIPDPVTFEHYRKAFNLLPIPRLFFNSIVIAVILIITNTIFCSLAGYTLARKRFFGREALFLLILSSMMIPLHIRLIPTYVLTNRLNMLNTYQGIILPSAVTAFGIFLMRQYFLGLPKEIEDAARIDGCSEWGVIFRIVLPMSKPALASLALYTLVSSLDDFLWPLVVTFDTVMRPLPVGITLFVGLVVYEWGPVMAMTTLTILPVVILYIILQSQFIRGLTAGAVKG